MTLCPSLTLLISFSLFSFRVFLPQHLVLPLPPNHHPFPRPPHFALFLDVLKPVVLFGHHLSSPAVRAWDTIWRWRVRPRGVWHYIEISCARIAIVACVARMFVIKPVLFACLLPPLCLPNFLSVKPTVSEWYILLCLCCPALFVVNQHHYLFSCQLHAPFLLITST